MKILTVANHKGGVGKTAIAAHLGWYLAEQGANVLLVDLDAQANFTGTFTSRDEVMRAGGAEALFSESAPLPTAINVGDRLSLVRASIELDAIDNTSELESTYAFRDRLPEIAGKHTDYIVLDTPPTLKVRTTAALAVSHRVVTPFVPEVYSITGLEDLFRRIQRVRRHINHQLGDVIGVANLVNAQASLHQELITGVSQRMNVLRPLLHRRIAVAEALASQQPVWTLRGAKVAADEWRALCGAVKETIG